MHACFASPPAPLFSGLMIFRPPGGYVAMGTPPVNFMLTNDTTQMALDQVQFNDKIIATSKAVQTLSESLSPESANHSESLKTSLKSIIETEADGWDVNKSNLLNSLTNAQHISLDNNLSTGARSLFICA